MPNYWFDHVHLISTNPMKTAEFYEKMVGARMVGTQELTAGRTRVHLDLNGVNILVMNPRAKPLMPGTPESGLEHFGLRTDDLEAAVKELKAKGVEFVMEITEIQPGLKISYLLGPENVPIELQEGSL
ncbi:VOC family protein [Chloroflexota bacterium]